MKFYVFKFKHWHLPPGGGYSIYPWVGRCGPAPHTLTLFKTKIADFPTLFKTELVDRFGALVKVVWPREINKNILS